MRRFAGSPCCCHTRIPVAIALRHLLRIGVPPKDLIDDIAAALRRAGVEFDGVFGKCVEVSIEWKCDMNNPQNKPPSLRSTSAIARSQWCTRVSRRSSIHSSLLRTERPPDARYSYAAELVF